MLFYVKSRMKEDKIPEMSELIESEGFPLKARYVFASLEDQHVGLTFWQAESQESFENIRKQLEEYLDILEVLPVISAEDVYAQSFEEKVDKQKPKTD